MSNHHGHQRQRPKQSSQPERRLSRFGGQSVPLSTSGTGRQILYHCPQCHHPWLQDGATSLLRLSAEEVRAKAERLHADLEHLPQMVCRLCLFEAGGSSFHIDEYRPAPGTVAYGLVWEHTDGMSLQAAIRPLSTLADPLGPADVPLQEETLHAVLSWLADLDTAGEVHLFSMAENALLGRGMPVKSGWQWKALCLVQSCPPLADLAVVVLAEARPAGVPLKPEPLIALWKTLAAVILTHITGQATERP